MTAYLFTRIGVLDKQGLDNPGLGFELLVGFTSGTFVGYSRIVLIVEEQCLLNRGSPHALIPARTRPDSLLRFYVGLLL